MCYRVLLGKVEEKVFCITTSDSGPLEKPGLMRDSHRKACQAYANIMYFLIALLEQPRPYIKQEPEVSKVGPFNPKNS